MYINLFHKTFHYLKQKLFKFYVQKRQFLSPSALLLLQWNLSYKKVINNIMWIKSAMSAN